jgi:hypothetical protein
MVSQEHGGHNWRKLPLEIFGAKLDPQWILRTPPENRSREFLAKLLKLHWDWTAFVDNCEGLSKEQVNTVFDWLEPVITSAGRDSAGCWVGLLVQFSFASKDGRERLPAHLSSCRSIPHSLSHLGI